MLKKIHFKLENIYFKYHISQHYCFYYISDQINAALVSIRYIFHNPKLSNVVYWLYLTKNVNK